jgi:hypothetical protein
MASNDFTANDFHAGDFSMDDKSEDDVIGPFPDDVLVDPKALGILRCLRMLAHEAAGLDLKTTATALSHAIEICAADQPRWSPAPACLN